MESTIKISEYLEVCYQTFGEPHNKPIILLSGLNTQMTHYTDSFCNKLSQKEFYVIKYDYRDVGRTLWLNGIKENYTLKDLSNDLNQLIEKLNLGKVVLFGRSMGGLISQIYSSLNPEKIDSLILIMTGTNNPELKKPSDNILNLMLGSFPKPNIDLEGYINHKLLFAKTVHGDYYPFYENEERLLILEDLKRGVNNIGGYRRQLKSLIDTGSVLEYTKTITTPTLIIHGDIDPMIYVDAALELHSTIKDSKLKILNGMGHDIPIELENKIVDLVTEHALKPSNLQNTTKFKK